MPPPIESTTVWRCACCNKTAPVVRNESPACWVYSMQLCEICAFPGDEVLCPDCVAEFKAAFDAVRDRRRQRPEAG